jgi:hypothetical protein
MTIEAKPQQLHELFVLLSGRQLSDKEVAPMVARALLALDDPSAYINDYPDDEWITEGYALDESQEGALRLLRWVLFDELSPWLSIGDKADELAERVIDRLIQDGIVIEDPPAQLRTLDEYRLYLNEQLSEPSGESPPKELVQFDPGYTDEVGFLVVNRSDVPRILELARRYRLRLNNLS